MASKGNAYTRRAFVELPESQIIQILNLGAKKLAMDGNGIERIKKAFAGQEYKLAKFERRCLDASLPLTVVMPARCRENSVTATAALLYMLKNPDDPIGEEIKVMFLKSSIEITFVRADKIKCATPSFESIEPSKVITLMLMMYLSEEHFTDEQFGYALKYAMTAMKPTKAPPPDEIAAVAACCDIPLNYRSLGEYKQFWENYGKRLLEKSPACVAPFRVFDTIVEDCGVAGENLADTLITKSMAYDAISAVVWGIDSWVMDKDIETYRRRNSFELMSLISGAAWEKDSIKEAFPFALLLRVMCEKYAKEIKENLRQKMFRESERASPSTEVDVEELHNRIAELEKMCALAKKREDELYQMRRSAQKRSDALQAKLAATQVENKHLRELIEENTLQDEADETSSTARPCLEEIMGGDVFDLEDEEDCAVRLDEILQKGRTVFVGGNENLMKKFCARHPGAIAIHNRQIASCDALIRNADAVLFKVDSISHGLYEKCKGIAQAAQTPFAYISDIASVKLMEKEVCELLENIFLERSATNG